MSIELIVHRTAISLDDTFKKVTLHEVCSDNFYAYIMIELKNREKNEVVRKNEKYRIKKRIVSGTSRSARE